MALSVNNPIPTVSTRNCDVNLMDPDPATIRLDDMAHALGHLTRYTGHSDYPIPVLRHLGVCDAWASLVEDISDPLTRLALLLHDAHEAYMGDWATPLKREINRVSNGAITAMEQRLDKAIWASLGLGGIILPKEVTDVVHKIDRCALSAEVRVGFPVLVAEGRWNVEQLPTVPQDFFPAVRYAMDMDLDQLRRSWIAGIAAGVEAVQENIMRGAVVEFEKEATDEKPTVH